MKRAIYHLQKLLGLIGTIGNSVEWEDTPVIVRVSTAKRFIAELTERMDMPA